MIVTSSLDGPGRAPRHRAGTLLLAAVDVEWTKNYRVKGGNVPFCYSVVYLAVPDQNCPVDLDDAVFWWTSAYVEHPDETPELISLADAELRTVLDAADRLAGHQFTSDLAVLAAAAGKNTVPAVSAARGVWRARRGDGLAERRVIDTRYDVDHVLCCASRRLVDVCATLDLDVTQPELRGTSMTAMHRAWLDAGDDELRERITVLNLRHSLSTGLVALRHRPRSLGRRPQREPAPACWFGRTLRVARPSHLHRPALKTWIRSCAIDPSEAPHGRLSAQPQL